MPEINEVLEPIAWLSGRWSSKEGKGSYPRIKDFTYHDEMEFICIGQPMYNFASTSRHPETCKPMHQERGFLCLNPGSGQLTFAVSHNFGITSMELGTYDIEKKEIVLESKDFLRAHCKPPTVKRFRRVLRLIAPDKLEVTLDMETDHTPMTGHLRAVYTKVTDNKEEEEN